MIELLFIAVPLFCIVMNKMVNYNPEPIFNVYQRPNGYYWFKVVVIFITLYIKRLINKMKRALKTEVDLLKCHEKLETNEELYPHPQAINAVHFNASNDNGDHFIVGMTRRNNKLMDGYLYVKINNDNIGLLQSSKLPDTTLFQTQDQEEFNAEGISVQCLDPMKTWKIKYQGKMTKVSDPSKIFQIDLEMIYTSDLPIINYETDSDPLTSAKCIALERWSKEYFQLLKEYSQTQYEQHGTMEGMVKINGETVYLEMDSSKIRTFGRHGDWRNVHRYNLHMFSAENGDRFTVGDFCFPLTVSSYKMGFVYSAKERKVHPISYSDFQLYQHGESGKLPIDYAFTIKAGKKTYTIKVDVIDSPYFYISKDWECKIVQRICSFRINSMKGWGTSECQQTNILGRNILNTAESKSTVKQLNQKQTSAPEISLQEERKESRKGNSHEASNAPKYPCEHCGKNCDSRVELWKHLRSHDQIEISYKAKQSQ